MNREPKCPYFSKCGGCQTQHILYSVQLKQKQKRVADALQIEPETIQLHHDAEYAYRNRMDFIFSHRGLGLRKSNNFQTIIPITYCDIANKSINVLLAELQNSFTHCDYFDSQKKTGTFRYAVIRASSQSTTIIFTLNQDSTRIDEATKLIETFAQKSTAQNILVSYVPKDTNTSLGFEYFVVKGCEYMSEKIYESTLWYHSLSFFQNNPVMAQKMVEVVFDILKDKNGHLLDLYGGVGTLGINCAKLFDSTTIVEEVEMSIDCAQKNIAENKTPNTTAIVQNAQNVYKLKLKKPLHVITDPPRSGMSKKAIERLLQIEPENILYVSCNPTQLAKELPLFLKKGYTHKSTHLFDLFAQTHHCEVLCELELKKNYN